MSDDDALHHDLCATSDTNNVAFQERSTLLLGLGRIFAFFCILFLHNYNRKLLRAKADDNVNVVPGLVLPYYFAFIYLYIGLSLLMGLIDVGVSAVSDDVSSSIYNWLIPFEQAVFHWFYEGLSFFLMRYGAGVKAIKRSLVISGMWSVLTFAWFFFIFCAFQGTFGQPSSRDRGYGLIASYFGSLLIFYCSVVFIPRNILFRRSALEFFGKWNIMYYSMCLIFATLAFNLHDDVLCPTAIISFFYVSFVQPMVLFRTLQIDSQYWQGLKPGKDNPLAEVWDHVDVETAQSMAEQVEKVNSGIAKAQPLPLLHYGLLDFDQSNAFVAGGFSRVYFGALRGERVAFKILFAMELTPSDVTNFYNEASLLHSLKHENIVECKGICVMPPALTMVLELCKYGSLFDFLYKPAQEVSVPVDKRKSKDSKEHPKEVVSAMHSSGMPSVATSVDERVGPVDIATYFKPRPISTSTLNRPSGSAVDSAASSRWSFSTGAHRLSSSASSNIPLDSGRPSFAMQNVVGLGISRTSSEDETVSIDSGGRRRGSFARRIGQALGTLTGNSVLPNSHIS